MDLLNPSFSNRSFVKVEAACCEVRLPLGATLGLTRPPRLMLSENWWFAHMQNHDCEKAWFVKD